MWVAVRAFPTAEWRKTARRAVRVGGDHTSEITSQSAQRIHLHRDDERIVRRRPREPEPAEGVERAGLASSQLDAIYLTGGSSALRPFQARLQERFAGTTLLEGDLFGGVASGLAYAAR